MIYNSFIDFLKNNVLLVSLIGGGVLLIILILIIVLIKHKSSKKPKLKIDEAYVGELIELLGTKDNITKIDVDGNKLKVSVQDLSKCNLEGIKNKAQSGVFVTDNNIKTLFMYDSEALRKEINKYKG